jgi:pimeloyl-ACP methyl ester carboxylesterase
MTDTVIHTESATSKYVNVVEDGTELRVHYNDTGTGNEALVLLHGSGPGATGWANFHRNVDAFANAGYRVILVDCPAGARRFDRLYRLALRPQRARAGGRAGYARHRARASRRQLDGRA